MIGLAATPLPVATSRGMVECAQCGDGPAVLLLHGALGGYDQALLLGNAAAGKAAVGTVSSGDQETFLEGRTVANRLLPSFSSSYPMVGMDRFQPSIAKQFKVWPAGVILEPGICLDQMAIAVSLEDKAW